MRRPVAVGIILVLLFVSVATVWLVCATMGAADEAACGAVAAASRGDARELGTHMNRDVSASDLESLSSQAPPGLNDPDSYGISHWRLTGPLAVSATVTTSDAPDYAAHVLMRWNWATLEWTVLSIQRI